MVRSLVACVGLLVASLPGGCGVTVPFAAQVAVPAATCRTVLRGNTQVVEVRTEPSGVTVGVPGYEARTTPAYFVLLRGRSYTLTLSKEGFKTTTAELVSRRATDGTAGTALGNAIDEASGAAWELTPDRLTVAMTPVGTAAVATAQAPPPASTAPAPAGKGAQATGAQAPGPAAVPDQIARLDRLLAEGAITQREHDALVALAASATLAAGAQEPAADR